MEQKNQPAGFPYTRRNGEESGTDLAAAAELKRKKRIKLAIYIAAFAVFQVIVITAFGMTVMKVKTPKIRLNNIRFQTLETGNSASSPSFDISLVTQVRVKNTNFGPYKFDNTTAYFTYQGTTVGEVVIPKGKAGFKSTKKMDVRVSLNSKALSSSNNKNLGTELSSGVLTLSSNAKTNGKVTLMLMMKKKKSAQMNCTISIRLSAKEVQSLNCK